MMIDFTEHFDEFVERIFVEELKEHILYQSKPDTDPCETVDNKVNLINGLLITLKYYTTQKEYQAFVEKLNEYD